MKSFLLTVALALSAAPAVAWAYGAPETQMLDSVAAFLEEKGYSGTAHQIRIRNSAEPVLVYAFELCQTRALGKTEVQILETLSRADISDELFWIRRSIQLITEQQDYCTAIGADQYIP